MTARVSPFWHVGSRRDPDQVKREGWREQGILAVALTDRRLNDWERQFILNLGRRLYGEPNTASN